MTAPKHARLTEEEKCHWIAPTGGVIGGSPKYYRPGIEDAAADKAWDMDYQEAMEAASGLIAVTQGERALCDINGWSTDAADTALAKFNKYLEEHGTGTE